MGRPMPRQPHRSRDRRTALTRSMPAGHPAVDLHLTPFILSPEALEGAGSLQHATTRMARAGPGPGGLGDGRPDFLGERPRASRPRSTSARRPPMRRSAALPMMHEGRIKPLDTVARDRDQVDLHPRDDQADQRRRPDRHELVPGRRLLRLVGPPQILGRAADHRRRVPAAQAVDPGRGGQGHPRKQSPAKASTSEVDRARIRALIASAEIDAPAIRTDRSARASSPPRTPRPWRSWRRRSARRPSGSPPKTSRTPR